MICPNCGYTSAPGTMFCGSCGTRLTPAPSQPNPYQPQSQPMGGYTPPQRSAYTPPPAYTPPAAPAAHPQQTANPYVTQAAPSAPAQTYQSYGSSMMQSPYITGASRSSAPVLSSSRDAAAQYTAVSTNVYSPQARAAAIASDQANKKKKVGGIVMTIIAVVILAATAVLLYMSGIFEQSDNSIYIPESSGSQQGSATPDIEEVPVVSGGDTASGSDISSDVSDSDVTVTAPDDSANLVGLNKNEIASVNAFISAFTEVGMLTVDGSVSTNALMAFAVSSLSLNSNVYDTEEFNYGDITYNYTLSEDIVSNHISRYFGENVKIYPAMGESGNGWIYYGNSYHFSELAQSQGFAIVTDYAENGELVDVSFNIYSSLGNDANYYAMTSDEVEADGCTLIGSGTAVLGKTVYNGRDTYLIQSIQASLN